MSTSFDKIHCLANVLRKDTSIQKLPSYQYYELCYKQLLIGKTSFSYVCHHDLDSYTPYSCSEYNYVGNGVDTDFEVSPAPETTQTNIYVGTLDDNNMLIETDEYTYDSSTNIISFNTAPANGTNIKVAFFDIGSFDDDLYDDECAILAECEQIAYYEAFLGNSKSLNQVLYGNTFKIHSQAEQLKQLDNISITQWRDRVDTLIKQYSYKRSTDGLKGLSRKR